MAQNLHRIKLLSTLGIRIRAFRKEMGLSQEGLANEAGLDRSYIGGVERGERNISFITLCKIAKALKVDVASLTKRIQEKFK
jgi:transcriptional regulator with XRE-family HTH domain